MFIHFHELDKVAYFSWIKICLSIINASILCNRNYFRIVHIYTLNMYSAKISTFREYWIEQIVQVLLSEPIFVVDRLIFRY